MQKIFNWTVGSFFRSIGRIIAYLVVGGLIAYLLSSNDFRIEDLFLDRVNASTNQRLQISNPTINGDGVTVPGIGWYVSNNQYYYAMNTQNPTQGVWNQVNFDFTTITFPANTNSMTIGLYVHNSDSLTQEYDYTAYSEGYMIYASGKNLYSLSLYYDGADGFNYCDPVGNNGEFFYFTCPVITNTFNRFALTIHTNKTSYNFASYFTFGIRSAITLDMEGNNISDLIANDNANTQAIINSQNANTSAINNQTQQQQQQHNELMDDNTTEADSEGQDFINNFSNNTHGLTGIITAPLTAIQSLASATCSSLVLPLPFTNNKTLTLPCMSTIYSTHFGAFYTMYQGIILALISYWVCVRLFTLAKGFKDPDDDKIEVVDL